MLAIKMRKTIATKRLKVLWCLVLFFCSSASFACTGTQSIQQVFASGAVWDMCWDVRAQEGVVLSSVYYTPPNAVKRKVFGGINVSQIQLDYDDNSETEYLVTEQGLGGLNLLQLDSNSCQQGILHQSSGRSVICQRTRPMGSIYYFRHTDPIHKQGQVMDVFSISALNGKHFLVQWSFYEDGTIEPGVGLTGQLLKINPNASSGWPIRATNEVAVGFAAHYFWKLDFDIGEISGDDIIEQIISLPADNRLKKNKSVSPVRLEAARQFDWDSKLFWRVRDSVIKNDANAYVSYELSVTNTGFQSRGNHNEAWLHDDVFFTKWNVCERFAVQNGTQAGCADSVDGFVSNSTVIQPEDVVIWYRQTHHYLPRDEDDAVANLQWSQFKLIPRDWTATNPF
jgi:primary-amine oxidase